jgi:O-antigen/teichoic acid export membrane protein
VWSVLTQLICIPLYIKFMGIEAYGLIGFYLMLQAMLQILDFGLSPTINREMARYSAQPDRTSEARDLVHTLEIGYWLIGIIIGGVCIWASDWIATHWIKAGVVSTQNVSQAVKLMGLLAFFQWPLSFYQGGLTGLHRQVLLNIIRVVSTSLGSGGAVLVLWLISPTIRAFLLWQVAVNAVLVASLSFFLWKSLRPVARASRFEMSALRNVWRFAAGMSGITLLGLVLTQIDKLLVSRLLSLKLFGYYSLAWAAANGLLIVSGVVFNVIFPRMSAQVASGDEGGLRRTYHHGTQLMAILVLPMAAVLLLFSFDVLHLWTGRAETAAFTSPILATLIMGSAFNALLYLPYALQLAFGWTKLNLSAGLLSILVAVPAIFPLTRSFGPVGAAAVWTVINTLNLLIVVPLMHRRLLPGHSWAYFGDLGFPLLAAFGTAALGRLTFSTLNSPVTSSLVILSVWLCALFAAIFAAPLIRTWAFVQLSELLVRNGKRVRSLG